MQMTYEQTLHLDLLRYTARLLETSNSSMPNVKTPGMWKKEAKNIYDALSALEPKAASNG